MSVITHSWAMRLGEWISGRRGPEMGEVVLDRRRVYIRICDSGREMMNQMKQEMLSSTLFGLRAYTPEELASMDECLCRLMELMKKFNCETDEPAKNVSV